MKLVTSNKDIQELEQILNKYNESLFNQDWSCKNLSRVLEIIQRVFNKCFDEDRIKIIGLIDGQDIESEEFNEIKLYK